jgi:hypothetical protein
MLSWYIDSVRTEKKYLEVVHRNVQPCMDYFCSRLLEMEVYDNDEILKVFKEIVEELPFLTLQTKKDCYTHSDDFWIKYNSYTQIRFDDGLKSIKRELVLSKILA